jgi:hypothetical protein
MATCRLVLEYINRYLNQQLSLAELVEWAETTLVEPDIPDDEDADAIMDVLAYLGAADTRGFPLTWGLLTDFIERLGGTVHVMVQSA